MFGLTVLGLMCLMLLIEWITQTVDFLAVAAWIAIGIGALFLLWILNSLGLTVFEIMVVVLLFVIAGNLFSKS